MQSGGGRKIARCCKTGLSCATASWAHGCLGLLLRGAVQHILGFWVLGVSRKTAWVVVMGRSCLLAGKATYLAPAPARAAGSLELLAEVRQLPARIGL